MSASIHTSLLIDADNKHRTRAHIRTRDDGATSVTTSVTLDAPGYAVIQSDDPAALRTLAAALLEAADKGDALLAADQRVVAVPLEAASPPESVTEDRLAFVRSLGGSA